jgi:hypothetical protein
MVLVHMGEPFRSVIEKNGGGEIRTRETLTGPPVFKTGAFNRSATPPVRGFYQPFWCVVPLFSEGASPACMRSIIFAIKPVQPV